MLIGSEKVAFPKILSVMLMYSHWSWHLSYGLLMLVLIFFVFYFTIISPTQIEDPIFQLGNLTSISFVFSALLYGIILAHFFSARRFVRSISLVKAKAIDYMERNRSFSEELHHIEADRDALKVSLQRTDDELAEVQEQSKMAVSVAQSVADFIANRMAEADAKAYLGLLGQLRRDFEKISIELTRGELQHIGRIIIYIDDLDRCPAERVTELLEACHVLLGFEGFVVVLAADPRWIGRSLQAHYKPQLGNQPDIDASLDLREPDGLASISPLHYLEKIIQIPYWLPPLDTKQCVQYITGLLEEAERGNRLPHAARPADSEIGFLSKLAFLLRSPRTIKRFLNIYQMMRDQDGMSGPKEGNSAADYRALATALALVHGQPVLANEIEQTLIRNDRKLKEWSEGLGEQLKSICGLERIWKVHSPQLLHLFKTEFPDGYESREFAGSMRIARRYSFLNPPN